MHGATFLSFLFKIMQEVLTIALSQRAGHLNSHFYNSLESYFDYSGASKSAIDPSVNFLPAVNGNTVSYYPRSLIYDAQGGFGALSNFEYVNYNQDLASRDEPHRVERIAATRVKKSEYQEALDRMVTKLPLLNTKNTVYWTDYSRVIYNPKSLNTLPNWRFDPETGSSVMKNGGADSPFIGYDLGRQEWSNDHTGSDFMDERFRPFLEQCDHLGGINVVTEIDSAWGGFSDDLLQYLRDEYVPKKTILTWGLQSDLKLDLNRIKSSLGVLSNSSLYIPLSKAPTVPGDFPLDSNSMWMTAALQTIPFESFNFLSSQKEPVSMQELASGLTMGSSRKIVTDVSAYSNEDVFKFSPVMAAESKTKRHRHVFSKSGVIKPEAQSVEHLLDEDFTKLKNDGTSSLGLKKYQSSSPVNVPSSFPDQWRSKVSNLSIASCLEVSNDALNILDKWRSFVSRALRGDEREFYLDEISNLMTEYQWGYESDDDYDD